MVISFTLCHSDGMLIFVNPLELSMVLNSGGGGGGGGGDNLDRICTGAESCKLCYDISWERWESQSYKQAEYK